MLVTTCLRVVTNSYEYLRVLTILLETFYKSCKSQCIIIRQQIVHIFLTSHLRILASSLRIVTCCCERFMIRTDCYELFTEKINPWTIVRRFVICQKICLSFHGSLTVSASCLRVSASYYGCLRLTTSWRSVRTRNKYPCM